MRQTAMRQTSMSLRRTPISETNQNGSDNIQTDSKSSETRYVSNEADCNGTVTSSDQNIRDNRVAGNGNLSQENVAANVVEGGETEIIISDTQTQTPIIAPIEETRARSKRDSRRGRIETHIAVAGQRGLIRVVSLKKLRNLFTLMGCGDSINELKLHPADSNLLLSASKDNSLRLWNLSTKRCVVIFGGLQGHRDEVLSCDFDLEAKFILSCGMDHSIKMWSLEAEGVEKTIELSYTYNDTKPFPVLNQHFPIFSTRSIHRNYVDCVRWFGNFVLSKSCENKIFCWKPNLTSKKSSDIPDQSEVLHSFDYGNCDIWYMRFAVSPSFDAIAAGNQIGKVFLWDISDEPSKPAILSHQKCSTAIRQVCFSPDSNIMVTVSDDSSVWRWDKA